MIGRKIARDSIRRQKGEEIENLTVNVAWDWNGVRKTRRGAGEDGFLDDTPLAKIQRVQLLRLCLLHTQ
jgi:hypothetical protein